MKPIAIVTCRVLPEPDTDQTPLQEACASAGVDVRWVPWDDDSVDWANYRAAALRSCWNYYEEPQRFLQWIHQAKRATRLVNPPDLLEWNLDKAYLLELERAGVPIVPTHIVSSTEELRSVLAHGTWERFVLKPTVSAGSFLTKQFYREESAEAVQFLGEILASRPAMVQPFVKSVEAGGEISLVHFDGEFSHAIVKQPRFHDGEESVSAAFQPEEIVRAAARRALNAVPYPWTYARVDLMLGDDGQWLLSELELLEPSLFLMQHPPAMARFVELLAAL